MGQTLKKRIYYNKTTNRKSCLWERIIQENRR